jgi:hypothetical protein
MMKKSQQTGFKLSNSIFVLMIILFLLVGLMVVADGQRRYRSVASINRGNCVADDCLMVESLDYPVSKLDDGVKGALIEAINDEYKALTVYQKVTSKLGMVRPFSMIMGAEEQHIASLKSLFAKYGVEVPVNNWDKKVTVPNTLKESCQLGIQAEVANASLYKDKLLPLVKNYEDITYVFSNLMNASELKHLPAFEKCN